MFALSLPMVIGAAGAGVETTYWYVRSQQLQSAADAAAYAAAIEKRSGATDDRVLQVATLTATQNGLGTDATAQIAAPSPQSVQVTLKAEEPRFLTAIFNPDPVKFSARAVASFNSAANACVLALSPKASKAALFSGSSNMALTGCSVMANSIATDAVTLQGSAKLKADCVISGGGVQNTSGLTLTSCPAVITQAPPVGDPLADLPTPTASGGCLSVSGGAAQPGRYCNGLSLSGEVTLAPGVYVVSGGDLKINANALVKGSGVTIYLSGSARATFNGNATVQLEAPASGTYAGVLMYGDRTSTAGRNVFNGTAASQMTGTLYFPSQEIDYLGNFSGKNGCSQIIGDTVQWSGNSTLSVDCAEFGMKAIPVLNLVKLTG